MIYELTDAWPVGTMNETSSSAQQADNGIGWSPMLTGIVAVSLGAFILWLLQLVNRRKAELAETTGYFNRRNKDSSSGKRHKSAYRTSSHHESGWGSSPDGGSSFGNSGGFDGGSSDGGGAGGNW